MASMPMVRMHAHGANACGCEASTSQPALREILNRTVGCGFRTGLNGVGVKLFVREDATRPFQRLRVCARAAGSARIDDRVL